MPDYQFVQVANNDNNKAAMEYCEALHKYTQQGFRPLGNVCVTYVIGSSVVNPAKLVYTHLLVKGD